MSNALPDDPISNKPANPRGMSIHMLQPQTFSNVSALAATGYFTDEHFGRFDYHTFTDPSGQRFEAWGSYDVGNNNVVSAVLKVTQLNGMVQVRTFRLGPTDDIADRRYIKIDNVEASKNGKKIDMALAGHSIVEGQDNRIRRMGQAFEIQTTPDDLWLVFRTYGGVWQDYMQGVLLPYAQKLAGAGVMTGRDSTFKPNAPIDNAHIAAVLARGLEHVG